MHAEAIGGPLAGAALGVVAGYAFDGMHTACEAAATGQVHLYGDVKAADDMAHDSTGEKAVEWGADLGEKLTVGAVLGAGGGRFCAAVNNIDSGIVEGAEKAAVSNCNQTAAGSLEKNAVAGTAETEAAGGVVTAEPGSITAPQDLSQAPLAEMQNPVGNVDATLQDVSGNSIGMKADAMTPAPKSALEGTHGKMMLLLKVITIWLTLADTQSRVKTYTTVWCTYKRVEQPMVASPCTQLAAKVMTS